MVESQPLRAVVSSKALLLPAEGLSPNPRLGAPSAHSTFSRARGLPGPSTAWQLFQHFSSGFSANWQFSHCDSWFKCPREESSEPVILLRQPTGRSLATSRQPPLGHASTSGLAVVGDGREGSVR